MNNYLNAIWNFECNELENGFGKALISSDVTSLLLGQEMVTNVVAKALDKARFHAKQINTCTKRIKGEDVTITINGINADGLINGKQLMGSMPKKCFTGKSKTITFSGKLKNAFTANDFRLVESAIRRSIVPSCYHPLSIEQLARWF